MTIRTPAARVKQGDLVVYLTSIKVKNLIADGFYTVDTLDPKSDEGYQRLLNNGRAKKLADYVVKGQDTHDAYLPTSILLATDKAILFSEQNNTVEIDTSYLGPLSVVDGQHRLEGLKMAAKKDPRVLDFEVPVNLAVNLSHIVQMCHFLIVNTTQKSVDKAVEQRITARLTQALNVEDMPSLPRWIYQRVQLGDVDKALKFVAYLNETTGSPWKGKVKMANEGSAGKTVNQGSFVKAVVRYVLTANNPLSSVRDLDKEKKIFLNYWTALATLLGDENESVLYKYNGVNLFCMFSIPLFMKCQNLRDYKVGMMEQLLTSVFDNIEGEYAGVGHPDWWRKGGSAGRLNTAALNLISHEMTRALHRGPDAGEFVV